jgi:HEAT repeat protein
MTETVRIMLEQLVHPDKNLRGPAAIALGGSCAADALDGLLARVGHEPDFYVREDITWALVRMGDQAIAPLIGLLDHENAAVRHHAVHTLGKINDARAVEALIRALRDSDHMVAARAAGSLKVIGDARAVPALAGVLGHPHRETQTAVTEALERFGADTVPAVLAALTDSRWPVREHAADVLGQIGDDTAVPALTAALRDDHWQVRFAAVTALWHIGGTAAKTALREMAPDADARVRELWERVKPPAAE